MDINRQKMSCKTFTPQPDCNMSKMAFYLCCTAFGERKTDFIKPRLNRILGYAV